MAAQTENAPSGWALERYRMLGRKAGEDAARVAMLRHNAGDFDVKAFEAARVMEVVSKMQRMHQSGVAVDSIEAFATTAHDTFQSRIQELLEHGKSRPDHRKR